MSKEKSMKFQIFNEMINDVFNDEINRLKFYNKKFVKLKC